MVMELTLGNVITVIALVIAALWALVRLLGAQAERRLDERFDELTRAMTGIAAVQDRNATAVLELEREFRRHQVDAARDFVRRDDFVRNVGEIGTRIDNFALRTERALEHLGVRKGGMDA